jgi:hypothetical protein
MSINKRVLVYFIGMALLVLLIIFLGINIYISTYYYGSKVDDMIEIADSVDDAYEES